MEELLIEEKAKRYDEALHKAKNYYSTTDSSSDIKLIGLIFPELKECEDKMMIQYFKDLAPFDKADELYEKYGFSHKDAIAWLEKQGEHSNFLSKIQVGDKVTRNEDGVLVNLSQLKRIAKPAEEYNITGIGSKNTQGKLGEMIKNLKPVNEVLEQKPDWNEKYIADVFEKVGLAKIAREQGNENLSSALQSALIELGKFMPQQTSSWSEEDEENMMMIEDRLSDYLDYIREDTSLTKLNKNSMKEEIVEYVNWLKSLKDRVQPQPKHGWSEEDKKIIDRIESEFLALHRGDYKNIDFNNDDNLSVLNWVRKIKFLCFQSRWKPSDEQMNTLEYYMHTLVCNEHKEILFGLYSCLKKLREE